eukprot:g30431.t1
MVGNRKVLLFIAYRAQMAYKSVSESTLGLTDVEETISGATDIVDQVGECIGEPLSDLQRLFGALDGVPRDGDGKVQEGEGGIRDGPGEFEVGVKGVGKVDELSKLLMHPFSLLSPIANDSGTTGGCRMRIG